MERNQVIPILAPTPEEAAALAMAARFLEYARQKLVEAVQGDGHGYHHATMLAELRDQCAEAAMLCMGLEFMTMEGTTYP